MLLHSQVRETQGERRPASAFRPPLPVVALRSRIRITRTHAFHARFHFVLCASFGVSCFRTVATARQLSCLRRRLRGGGKALARRTGTRIFDHCDPPLAPSKRKAGASALYCKRSAPALFNLTKCIQDWDGDLQLLALRTPYLFVLQTTGETTHLPPPPPPPPVQHH